MKKLKLFQKLKLVDENKNVKHTTFCIGNNEYGKFLKKSSEKVKRQKGGPDLSLLK